MGCDTSSTTSPTLNEHCTYTLNADFGNVCELDIVYGMQEAYAILDEVLISACRFSFCDRIARSISARHDSFLILMLGHLL